MTITIVTCAPEHIAGVTALWREAFPEDPSWNDPALAIPAKLAFQPELFLVALESGRVVGSVMAGFDGYRGWLARVAVRRSHRRQNVGTALVREAEVRLQALGCIKINLQVRDTNAAVAEFYRRLGYAVEPRLSMAKRLGGDAAT